MIDPYCVYSGIGSGPYISLEPGDGCDTNSFDNGDGLGSGPAGVDSGSGYGYGYLNGSGCGEIPPELEDSQ